MQPKFTPRDFLEFLKDLDKNDETRDYQMGALSENLVRNMDPADFESVLELVDDLEEQSDRGRHGDIEAALARGGITDPEDQAMVLRGLRLLQADHVSDRLKGRSKPAAPSKPTNWAA